LGFFLVGYGCTTCIGNSGPLPEPVAKAVTEGKLVASAVLSGNRNFEGRVHPLVRAAYLTSPPLVVAYALAGTTDIDLATEPLGKGSDGQPVFLKEIWPTAAELSSTLASAMRPETFQKSYGDVFHGDASWQAIQGAATDLYPWKADSTYIQNPPYFEGMTLTPPPVADIVNARVLAIFGDSITTDHISPAGDIAKDSPAGAFLEQRGVSKKDFNSYGSRRGNHLVMMRGTFANIRIKNLMVPGVEGGVTVHHPSGDRLPIFDAAERYQKENISTVILAGKEYGSGSSRDWAAKGPMLQGVRTVIAESYERIHRSNLVGMGILPLQFLPGQSAGSLGLTGQETLSIAGLSKELKPRSSVSVRVTQPDGRASSFDATLRLDGPVDVEYYRNGGILQTVLRSLVGQAAPRAAT